MSLDVIFTPQAVKDAKKLSEAELKAKTQRVIEILTVPSLSKPLPYEKLVGDLKELYSRRLNIQHRLVYAIYPDLKLVKVLRMWTHYK